MKTRNIITAIFAVIAAAIVMLLIGTNFFGVVSGINLALIIIIGGVLIGAILDRREKVKQGFVVQDEMSTIIQAKSGNAAFQIGNYIWLALLWYEFLSNNWLPTPTIGSPEIVLIGMMGQIAVYFVYSYINGKKVQ